MFCFLKISASSSRGEHWNYFRIWHNQIFSFQNVSGNQLNSARQLYGFLHNMPVPFFPDLLLFECCWLDMENNNDPTNVLSQWIEFGYKWVKSRKINYFPVSDRIWKGMGKSTEKQILMGAGSSAWHTRLKEAQLVMVMGAVVQGWLIPEPQSSILLIAIFAQQRSSILFHIVLPCCIQLVPTQSAWLKRFPVLRVWEM